MTVPPLTPETPRVLLITSQKKLAKKISEMFAVEFDGVGLDIADNGQHGLEQVYQQPPCLLMVDASLTDMSGVQLCRVLKHDPAIRKIPILLLTHQEDAGYERLSELSLVADMFLPLAHVPNQLSHTIRILMRLFEGLDDAELEQIKLIQQSSVQVNATNRVVQLLDQSVVEAHIMRRMRQLFNLIHNRGVLTHMLFSLLDNLLDYDLAGLVFIDRANTMRKITYHLKSEGVVSQEQWLKWTEDVFNQLSTAGPETLRFKQTGYEVINSDLPTEGKALSLKHTSVYPFFMENTLVGALVFMNKQPVQYDLIFPFSLILQEMGTLMRVSRYYSEAQLLSITDKLTGLHSYQHFINLLEREMQESRRHSFALSLAHISIDEFRELNTQWGHDLADAAIQRVAKVALETFRNVDYVARSSGSRILALFPNTPLKDALTAVERLQKEIAKQPLLWKDSPINLSITVGLVELNDSVSTGSQFIEQAQQTLDHARQKGRNRVELLQ